MQCELGPQATDLKNSTSVLYSRSIFHAAIAPASANPIALLFDFANVIPLLLTAVLGQRYQCPQQPTRCSLLQETDSALKIGVRPTICEALDSSSIILVIAPIPHLNNAIGLQDLISTASSIPHACSCYVTIQPPLIFLAMLLSATTGEFTLVTHDHRLSRFSS